MRDSVVITRLSLRFEVDSRFEIAAMKSHGITELLFRAGPSASSSSSNNNVQSKAKAADPAPAAAAAASAAKKGLVEQAVQRALRNPLLADYPDSKVRFATKVMLLEQDRLISQFE